jgi:hypothetical protein
MINEKDLPGAAAPARRPGIVDLGTDMRNLRRAWATRITGSPLSLSVDRLVAATAGAGLSGATVAAAILMATGRSLPAATALAVVACVIAVLCHGWAVCLLATRTPPRTGRNWQDLMARNKAQRSFGLLPRTVRYVLTATLSLGLLLSAVAASTAVQNQAAGLSFDRLVAGLLMFAFSIQAAISGSELVRRTGTSPAGS